MARSRPSSLTRHALRLGACVIDPSLNEVRCGDAVTRLRPKSMAVLLRLAEAPGEVLSRQAMFAAVWGHAQLSDEVLTQAIAELRRALHDPANRAGLIQTVPRRGYRLVQPMRALEPEALARPDSAPSVRAIDPVSGIPRRSALVGRHKELALLAELLEATAHGRGALALLSGEAGVGKSRLAEEVVNISRDADFLAFSGRCSQYGDTALYLPFAEMIETATRHVPPVTLKAILGETAADLARAFPELRRVFPDLPPPIDLPPEQQRRYFFNSFLRFLRNASRVQPLCLVLDDLHWADDPSLALLQHLAPELESMKVLVIGAFRSTELGSSRALAPVLELLISRRLARPISLERLAVPQVGELLESLSRHAPPPEWIRVFHERTEGNPFFVEELFHHLRDQGNVVDRKGAWRADVDLGEAALPQNVRWVLSQRLARQSAGTQRLLSTAALVGRSFSARLVRRVANLAASEMRELLAEGERTRLLVPLPDEPGRKARELRYAFDHDLIRQTLLAEYPETARRATHLRIARAMRRLYGDGQPDRAAGIAWHLLQAGEAAEPAECIRYLQQAATHALEVGAGQEALRYADQALGLATQDRGALSYLRGIALRSLTRWAEALAAWDQSIAECRQSGDNATQASACKQIATLLHWAGDGDSASAAAKAGLAVADGLPAVDRFELLALTGTAELVARRPEQGRLLLQQATDLSLDEQDSHLIALSEMYAGLYETLAARADERAEQHLERSVGLLRDARDPWNQSLALAALQLCRAALGHWRALDAMADEAHTLAARLGHLGALEWMIRSSALSRLAQQGEVSALAATAEEQYELAARHELAVFLHGNALVLANCMLLLDRPDDARAWCERAARVEPFSWRGTAWGLLLKLRATIGDDGGLAEFDEHRALLPRADQENTWSAWKLLTDVAEALALLDELPRIADQYRILAVELATSGAIFLPAYPASMQKTAGILAAGTGDWDKAEQHFETAREQTERLPHRLERAEVLRWHGWMLERRATSGDRQRAEQLLALADHQYRELGLHGHGERTRRAMRSA